MANPILVEVTRGPRVESAHRAAAVIADAQGRTVLCLGDIDAPVFPRSAVKALQAIPLMESGAADAWGFGARELALAQASHAGEPAHVEGAAAMLAAIGLSEGDLECGAHMPSHSGSAAALIKAGLAPTQLHNNCSGKHANFLALARHLGIPHAGYVQAKHPVQQMVREVLSDLTGARLDADVCGVDGCSIPTYAAPLRRLALAFARFGTGAGLSASRATAAERLFAAATAEPYYIAGTGRFDTVGMQLLRGAALLKTGAEGVYCAAIPHAGLGIALKCDDGATRASEAVMAAILAGLMPEHEEAFRAWSAAPVLTRRGVLAGEVRAVADAFAGIRPLS